MTGQGVLVRWLKFNAVGAVGICVQLGLLAVLTSRLRLNYLVATILAVEAAVLHNLFWHERFTWADRKPRAETLTRLWKFNLSTGALSILGNLLAMKLFVEMAGLPYVPANLLSIAACSVLNFFVADRLVFIEHAPKTQNPLSMN